MRILIAEDDARSEGHRLTELVNQLVSLVMGIFRKKGVKLI